MPAHGGGRRGADYAHLKAVVLPAFLRAGGRGAVDVVHDDALPKPVLLPRRERAARDRAEFKSSTRLQCERTRQLRRNLFGFASRIR